MPTAPTRPRRPVVLVAAGLAAALMLTACGGEDAGSAAAATRPGTVTIGALSNGAATEVALPVSQVDSIRATLPAAVRDRGRLVIGLGLLPSGAPPLGYVGSDQKTLTGSEPDLGRLVAAVLGLRPVVTNATWENMFVGFDSQKTDVGFSNITVTEERKKKYDFACYREDNLGFEVLKSSAWNFGGRFENLAGRTVAVASGTNQEKILLQWQARLEAQGKTLKVSYFPDQNAVNLALAAGKIDTYFGPNPSVAYHVTQSAATPNPTRSAGTFSGAGATLQGLICATTRKGSGLARPVADAINHLIRTGQYARWLAAWNLSDEAVRTAQVNPPGLPADNS